jgi:hypothetical protein
MRKRIYLLRFDMWDSPIEYYFSTKKKATTFRKRYIGRWPWRMDSFILDPTRLRKYDAADFINTRAGKKFLAWQKADKEKRNRAEARKARRRR